MISSEQFLLKQFPSLTVGSKRYALLNVIFKHLLHEQQFKEFAQRYPLLSGFDFIDKALEYFQLSVTTNSHELEHIPVRGRVVIIANHPIGSLDGFALLQTIRKLRPDVKVVANELLMALSPLHEVLLPVDNSASASRHGDIKRIHQFLNDEGALIIFPAGEVSRMTSRGIRDSRWQKGFLHFAQRAKAPIIPIHITARNSLTFYGTSLFYKPLASLLLVKEMFKHNQRCIKLNIGQAIPFSSYGSNQLTDALKIKWLQKQLYRVGKHKPSLFKCETAIAHPEERVALKKALQACQVLGKTSDGKQIYLYQSAHLSVILKELGRLREMTFRAVGEGTGQKRDLDPFDHQYMHLILWDEQDLEVVGAYRFTPVTPSSNEPHDLYTQQLFDYNDKAQPYLEDGIELGRSFVQPRYWGKRSLEYLWQGIGAFLAKHRQYRYLIGPVTLSAAMPKRAQALLVYFYLRYFPAQEKFALAHDGYYLSEAMTAQFDTDFAGQSYTQGFIKLKAMLANMGVSVPTLYKQYTELCEQGGVQFIDFNVDASFNHCIDGLVVVDLDALKPKKHARYIAIHQALPTRQDHSVSKGSAAKI